MAFARTLVATTDRLFSLATAEGSMADLVRTRLAPLVAGSAFRLSSLREAMFRVASQTMVNYRGAALSQGRAGQVEGGDRLPWVGASGVDNHEPLDAIAWQVHVYGTARPELQDWCKGRLPLHVFDWRPGFARAGLARDAAYLVRPDGYVGLADPEGSPKALEGYLRERGIAFAGPSEG